MGHVANERSSSPSHKTGWQGSTGWSKAPILQPSHRWVARSGSLLSLTVFDPDFGICDLRSAQRVDYGPNSSEQERDRLRACPVHPSASLADPSEETAPSANSLLAFRVRVAQCRTVISSPTIPRLFGPRLLSRLLVSAALLFLSVAPSSPCATSTSSARRVPPDALSTSSLRRSSSCMPSPLCKAPWLRTC